MDLRRLRAGEWIAAAAGVALLVSLFLPWYDVGEGTRTGWAALAVTDVVLAIVAIAAIAQFFIVAVQPTAAIGIAYEALLFLVSLVSLVVAVVHAAGVPDDATGRAVGLWVGLAGAIGVTAGTLVAMRDERLDDGPRSTDGTGRPVPPPPEIEAIPTPPPAPRTEA